MMGKPKNCLECKFHRYFDWYFIECVKYGWKIHRSVAMKECVCCDEDDKHHVFPSGRKVPVKLYMQNKVML